MQANNNGGRRTWMMIPLVALGLAAGLSMALLVALHGGAQAHASARAQDRAQAVFPDPAGSGISDSDSDNGGGGGKGQGQGKRDEVVGAVITRPNDFLGNWQIAVNSLTVLTVVVDADTKIQKFKDLPALGEWVEVRGTTQADGSVLAQRLRPSKFESGEVVVRLNASGTITDVADRYKLTLIDTLLSSANIYLFASEDAIEEDAILKEMGKDPGIEWAELNYVSQTPSDTEGHPYRTWKWGSSDPSGYTNHVAFQQVHLLPAEARYGGSGVIVAVLDTGIDAAHPALSGRLLPGRDLVNDDDVPQDGPEAGEAAGLVQGHGTHVSGIIARIAPQSKLLPLRVLDVNGRGNTYVLAYAIEWAVDHGADVINLSLGSEFDSSVLGSAIAAAQARGVVIVAAAGNDDVETPQYPANFPGVLGVTAVDENDHKAPFANYGAAAVDLAAPGVGITSTVPLSGEIAYAAWSGTSMATPFVSGAAALVKEQQPDASVAAITEQLIAAGGDLDTANPQYVGQLGRMLDIAAALHIPDDTPGASIHYLYLPALGR